MGVNREACGYVDQLLTVASSQLGVASRLDVGILRQGANQMTPSINQALPPRIKQRAGVRRPAGGVSLRRRSPRNGLVPLDDHPRGPVVTRTWSCVASEAADPAAAARWLEEAHGRPPLEFGLEEFCEDGGCCTSGRTRRVLDGAARAVQAHESAECIRPST